MRERRLEKVTGAEIAYLDVRERACRGHIPQRGGREQDVPPHGPAVRAWDEELAAAGDDAEVEHVEPAGVDLLLDREGLSRERAIPRAVEIRGAAARGTGG